MFVDAQGMETRHPLDTADMSYMQLIEANEQPVQPETTGVRLRAVCCTEFAHAPTCVACTLIGSSVHSRSFVCVLHVTIQIWLVKQ